MFFSGVTPVDSEFDVEDVITATDTPVTIFAFGIGKRSCRQKNLLVVLFSSVLCDYLCVFELCMYNRKLLETKYFIRVLRPFRSLSWCFE